MKGEKMTRQEYTQKLQRAIDARTYTTDDGEKGILHYTEGALQIARDDLALNGSRKKPLKELLNRASDTWNKLFMLAMESVEIEIFYPSGTSFFALCDSKFYVDSKTFGCLDDEIV